MPLNIKNPEVERLVDWHLAPGRKGVGTPTLAEVGLVLAGRLEGDTVRDRPRPFGARHWRAAVEVFRRFGNGRPPAALNFRHSLLWRFEDPTDAQAVERLGLLLREYVEGTEQCGPDPDGDETVAAIEAASDDLQETVREFRAIAKRREQTFRPEVLRLCRFAEEWAEKANALVRGGVVRTRRGPPRVVGGGSPELTHACRKDTDSPAPTLSRGRRGGCQTGITERCWRNRSSSGSRPRSRTTCRWRWQCWRNTTNCCRS